ncbi:PDDEXK nuclease domain-containing protein [Pontibacter sp. G13]|uniref:PDDEXK nuclease domain-containing protein n=1 Tax=Pontibacter sp. G13 TaxID=3074898 RepID=UPI00288977C0|nr:PDDEXK nuclease domain-containing protein [Pontibacter sp. G13]WNJ17921.1 PDDEXK nuclease domain-containing protein [Pontibacter sp. G13]
MSDFPEISEQAFFRDIKAILSTARSEAYRAINHLMVEAYWLIGKKIVEQEQAGADRATYGTQLIKRLSQALTEEFGRGFSVANLKNFRQFYLTYPSDGKTLGKSYALRSQLTWTHHRLIMREEDEAARMFYLTECKKQNWSTRTLERHIHTLYYQRTLSTQKEKPVEEQQTLDDFIKDPYVFEFLNINQSTDFSETSLEQGLITHLEKFLLELGKGFSFVGRQYRISSETEHYFIDLVFYHYLMKCFVLFDLKIGKLTHQDIGQMDMYRRMFDDLKRPEGDEPTIGIILCTSKSDTVVKYSVMNDHEQLFAAKYLPYLPSKEELIAEIERDKRLIQARKESADDA